MSEMSQNAPFFGHVLQLLDAVLDGTCSALLLVGGHVVGHRIEVDGDVLYLEKAEQKLAIGSRYEQSDRTYSTSVSQDVIHTIPGHTTSGRHCVKIDVLVIMCGRF